MSTIIIWSVAAIAVTLVAIDYLKDSRWQRRVDRACAELMSELEHL